MEIEQILIKLQEVVDRSIRNEGRIKKLESENSVLHQLATSVAVMAEQMKTMNKNVTNLTDEVEEIKAKPAKRWEAIITHLACGIVGAVITYIAAKLGL